MIKVFQVISFRQNRYRKESHRPWLKLGILGALLFSLVFLAISLTSLVYAVNFTRELPSAEILPSLLEPPDGMLIQPTRIYDRSGQHLLATLQNPNAIRKQYLYMPPAGQARINRASPYLINATILEFDPDFWTNPGFKLDGIVEGSHSTLAQVLVANLVLFDEPPSLIRNIRERILAAQLTSKFGRNKILEWYLNSAQYGETIFGVDAAAWVYFGKPAADLSLAEVAMLTAISEKPLINPLGGSQILTKQQELIIQKMLVKGLVTGIEAQQALSEEIKFQPQVNGDQIAPAFTAFVLNQLNTQISLEMLYRGGFEIITTLDYSLQIQADCAVQSQIALFNGNQPVLNAIDGTVCDAGSLLPEVSEARLQDPGNLAAQVVVINPQSSQIIAMVSTGGSGSNSNILASHQTGLILSPFLYLTAFTRGMSPATMLWDIPPTSWVSSTVNLTDTTNEESITTYHGPVSLRKAFVNDYIGAGQEVWQQVGGKHVLTTEAEFGFNTSSVEDIKWEDFTQQNASLLNVTQAYAVLANQGIFASKIESLDRTEGHQNSIIPSSVLLVKEIGGREIVNHRNIEEIPVTSRQLAYLVTNVLSDERARWDTLGRGNGLEIGQPAAGKVSLIQETGEAWVVGYTPQLVVGVRMEGLLKYPEGIESKIPVGVWHSIMSYYANQQAIQDFLVPPGIKFIQVCDPTGMLPSPMCLATSQEVFLDGSEPSQVDDSYRKYIVDRETGLLATIFTPPELLEEKTFLVMPEQVKAWAKSAGLDVPPDKYDSISMPGISHIETVITTPQMFTHVRGVTNILGNAYGDEFSYYRLEIGKGLNPQEWLQVGVNVDRPVNNGHLGSWDTSGLQGLYVLKLMVVNEDNSFSQSIIQVTIDNTLPEVMIISPEDGEEFPYKPGKNILINTSVKDNLVVERVEIYVDGQIINTITDSPYIIGWEATLGKHTLLVRVYDLAGNQSQSSLVFSVSR